MPKTLVLFVATILLAALSVSGCSGDDNASSASSTGGTSSTSNAGPGAGQSALTVYLSGGHLADTLKFSGTVDKTMYHSSSSITFLGGGLNFTGSNGTAVLEQIMLDVNSTQPGTYPAKAQDIDMVFNFPAANIGYSLQPRPGSGTVKLEQLGHEHVRIHLDFDASPTNIDGENVVFHVKGVLESRPRD